MLDFSNLTQEQKEFFTNIWEKHQQQTEQEGESVKHFNAYVEQRRKQEDEQTKAAEHLKTLLR